MADNRVSPIVSVSNKGQKDLNADPAVAEVVENLLLERKPLDKDEEITWFQTKIKIRKCSSYNCSDGKNICQCGYIKEKHTGNVERQEKESEKQATNAYGEIKFKNIGGNTAKFVRLDWETDRNPILELMMHIWKMEKPNLLISVAGSSKTFEMKPRLRDACSRGLIKALQGTGPY